MRVTHAHHRLKCSRLVVWSSNCERYKFCFITCIFFWFLCWAALWKGDGALVQPILAYGYTGSHFSIFNGYVDLNSVISPLHGSESYFLFLKLDRVYDWTDQSWHTSPEVYVLSFTYHAVWTIWKISDWFPVLFLYFNIFSGTLWFPEITLRRLSRMYYFVLWFFFFHVATQQFLTKTMLGTSPLTIRTLCTSHLPTSVRRRFGMNDELIVL